MAWVRAVAGRLKTDIRYSSALCYNTFPVPPLSESNRKALEDCCWSVISERDRHPGKTLAELYDPELMPFGLSDSHRTLDETFEKIYLGRPFRSDAERLEHLFDLYVEMTSRTDMEAALA